VPELAHDLLTDPVPTGAPITDRRPSGPTRAVLLLATLAVTTMVTAGCTPTTAASTGAASRSGAAGSATSVAPGSGPASAPPAADPRGGLTSSTVPDPSSVPAGGGVLPVEDPDHSAAQPFPAAGTCHARAVPNGTLPDPACTPGATDPHVTQATIATTICRSGGYTNTVRPPASVTGTEKRSAMRAYNDTAPTSSYELDHLVSLELGGSPNSPHNLWPEPGAAPNPKDKLETALHDLVCSHRMTLTDAQNAIATDWVNAYRQVLGTTPPAP